MSGPLGSEQSARGRLYKDPDTGKRYPSVTTVIGVLDKPFLKPWVAKVVAERAVDNLEDLYRRVRTNREDARKWLSSAHRDFSGSAALRGSDLHDLAERHDKGEEIVYDLVSAESLQMLSHYQQFLKDCSVQIIASEASLVNRTLGYGGAADAIALVPVISDQPIITDIKTSAKGPYSSWAMQLAAYSRAEWMVAKGGDFQETQITPMIPVSQDHAAVIQITAEGYRVFQADISGQYESFTLLHDVWSRDLNNAGDLFNVAAEGQSAEQIDPVAQKIRAARSRAELTIVWKDAERNGQWDTEKHVPIAKERAQQFEKAA